MEIPGQFSAEIDIKGTFTRVEMREGFANIQTELKDIRLRIDALEVATQNVSGFAKEIDHLLQRVGAIEKHLGIHHNIAA